MRENPAVEPRGHRPARALQRDSRGDAHAVQRVFRVPFTMTQSQRL